MQDGVGRPVGLQLLDFQPLKQLFFALEVSVQSAEQQALAEPPGTAEEVIPARCGEPVHKLGLVNIKVAVLYQALEALYSYRVLFHIQLFYNGKDSEKRRCFKASNMICMIFRRFLSLYLQLLSYFFIFVSVCLGAPFIGNKGALCLSCELKP